VAQAKEALREAKDEVDGTVKAPQGCLAIRVSRQHLGRALRVVHALFKASEQRGWPVKVRDDHTIAVVDGVEIATKNRVAVATTVRVQRRLDRPRAGGRRTADQSVLRPRVVT
jgi:hypothetical protein